MGRLRGCEAMYGSAGRDALARDVRFNDDGPLKQFLLPLVVLDHVASDGAYYVNWIIDRLNQQVVKK